jgi:hypothetical protein
MFSRIARNTASQSFEESDALLAANRIAEDDKQDAFFPTPGDNGELTDEATSRRHQPTVDNESYFEGLKSGQPTQRVDLT